VTESATNEFTQPTYWYPWTEKLGRYEVTFKLMRPQDEDTVEQALLKFTQSLPASDLVFLRMDITQPDIVHEWVENILRDRTTTVLAEVNGEVVGYGNLHYGRVQWTRHIGEIRVLVGAKYRGIGLGEVLVNEMMKLAREKGLTRVVAHLGADQPRVRAMFERLGFHAEALLTDWLKDRNHQKHDLVIMTSDVEG
jgi:L-amino acid N-acyltransferase YncA